MPKTSDNDKKAHDNNAKHMQKNMQEQANYQAGKHDYSKKPTIAKTGHVPVFLFL